MLGGWAQVKTALGRTVKATEAEGMETTTVEIAALEVIIVGREKAVAPTEAVAQGIAEVRQARAQVRQARGMAQAASAILVTVQAPGQEVVAMAARAQEVVGIPP